MNTDIVYNKGGSFGYETIAVGAAANFTLYPEMTSGSVSIPQSSFTITVLATYIKGDEEEAV